MRSRRGVSLIELLIAITVLGIITAAVTQLLISESRSNEVSDAAREARGVSRSAINLLESELRMAEPGGLIAPTDDSTITIREPYAFGVICSAFSSATVLTLLPSIDFSGTAAAGHGGWAWRDATGGYVYETNTSVGTEGTADCTAAGLATFSGGTTVGLSGASGGTLPAEGAIGFLWRQMTYSIRTSVAYPGRRGLFRTAGANGAAEELASPFSEGSRFRWYILNDSVPGDTLPTDLTDVRGIQFVLNGESARAPRTSGAPLQAPFSTSIFFMNRPN